jgi:hypothetical protein
MSSVLRALLVSPWRMRCMIASEGIMRGGYACLLTAALAGCGDPPVADTGGLDAGTDAGTDAAPACLRGEPLPPP